MTTVDLKATEMIVIVIEAVAMTAETVIGTINARMIVIDVMTGAMIV